MFRFTIRDLLWLMVVVGMGVGWCVEHSAFRRQSARWEAEREVLERDKLKPPGVYQEQLQRAYWHYGPGPRTGYSPEVDWSVLGSEYTQR
jgi:hypothetical protein